MTQLIEPADSRRARWPWLKTSGRKLWLVVGISILVLLPCIWHRKIEAGDLGSHEYNAWLSLAISRGQAPGLYIAPQWNNILADTALARLGGALGFSAAEKIVVGLSALIFFWGAFVFITVVAQRPPWFLIPALAMVAYGYTFQMGFVNYYLSIGLAFWVLALVWRGGAASWIIGLALTCLVLSAHLMGLIWLVGTAAYITLAESRLTNRIPGVRWILPILALIAIVGIHFYVAHIYQTFAPVTWHVYYFAGFDQMVLYGHRYRAIAAGLLLLTILIALPEAIRQRRNCEFWRTLRTPLELWVITLFGTAMLWADIMIPRYATGFTYIAPRLSSVTAILGLCILGFVRPRRWHAVALALCAAVFFAWMYQDTGRINRMEEAADRLVEGLPERTRVIQSIFMPPGSRVGASHILDRACIGRCFAYANYEPASRQFRIRAMPGNLLVTASSADSEAMQQGRYIVRPEDLPLAQVYQCDQKDLSRLCIRNLTAGELNGHGGYLPTY
jgi:hypothetical protein